MDLEKENTMRALRDEPHLVTAGGCRFGWHRWTLWGDPYRVGDQGPPIQNAYCGFCNKIKVRTVRDERGRSL